MYLYLVPALGSREDPLGVRPELPADQPDLAWAGVYDDDSHQYVLRTRVPIEELESLEDGAEVGFDYSALLEPTPVVRET